MASPDSPDRIQPKVGAKRRERASRILDAAAALILRWGYDKTTLDDISREAGVAKGTLYLHWKTREELFAALVKRESILMGEDLLQGISQAPDGATLRGIYKQAALALIKRPLIKAFILQDLAVIGKMARREQSTAAYADKLAGFNLYLQFLRERGLIRTDLSANAQIYTVAAVFMGFFLIAPLVPDELKLSDEALAELIGETIHRTLETDRAIPADELQRITAAFMVYFDEIQKNLRGQIQQMLNDGSPLIKETA